MNAKMDDEAETPCHEWAFDETVNMRYCIRCQVEDSDPPTAIRFALCPGAFPLRTEGRK